MTWHKYKAVRTIVDGISFPSKLEAAVYEYLKLRSLNKEISDLELQSSVRLTDAQIGWKVDFKYFDKDLNEYVWAEAKGKENQDYLIKLKLWKHYGPGRLFIYKGSYNRFKMAKEVIPLHMKENVND